MKDKEIKMLADNFDPKEEEPIEEHVLAITPEMEAEAEEEEKRNEQKD